MSLVVGEVEMGSECDEANMEEGTNSSRLVEPCTW